MTDLDRAGRRNQIRERASALAGAGHRNVSAAVRAPQAAEGDAPTTAELWLYGVVGGYWDGFDAESVAYSLRGLDVEQIQVRLHSPGGNAIDGIAVGNLLRNHPARVTVVVDGLAASAASIVALAGDEVVMSPGSQMMIHDPWMLTVGNSADLTSDAAFLDKQAENYASIYAARGDGDQAHWREVMLADGGKGTWYSADEAVAAGLADRVGNITAVSAPPQPSSDSTGQPAEDAVARAAFDLEVMVHPDVAAAWRQSPTNPPAASAAGSSTTTEGGSAVAFSDAQITDMRRKLGIAEDADETTILAALDESLSERAETPLTATATVAPAGMALVDEGTLAALRSDAAAGREARNEQQAAARREAVAAAVSDGRIPPARREHWEAQLAADEGALATLQSLAPGTIPVESIGHDGQPDTTEADATYQALFGEKAGDRS